MAIHNLLKQPYAVCLSGNPVVYTYVIQPYNAIVAKQSLSILVRVLVEIVPGSGNFQEVKRQGFYPDDNGKIELDIQNIIDAYVAYYLPRPNLGQMVKATNQYLQYQTAFSLQQNGVSILAETFTAIRMIIKGGMAYNEWHPTEIFTNYLQQQQNFLCFTTAYEKAFPTSSSFMFFLAPSADTYTCHANMIDDSGNAYTFALPNSLLLNAYEIGCVPCGFTQLGLQSLIPDGNFVSSYNILIVGASAGIVAKRIFNLDFRNFYNPSTIVYRNSLGGLETLVLRGQIDFEADYAIQQAQVMTPPAYYTNLNLDTQFDQLVEESPAYNGDTGFNDIETTDKLRDFFLSRQRLELRDGKFLPIILVNKNVKFFGNRDNLISIQLQWQMAFVNEYFTKRGIMPIYRTCPAMEALIVDQSTRNQLQIKWALPFPYDMVEVDIIVGGVTYTYRYSGNVGAINQPFINPAGNGQNAVVVARGRVVCNADSTPIDYGPYTVVSINVVGNSLPVLANDTFSVNSGLTAAAQMPFSVLDNDYDPDGDPLAVIAASGVTNAGGMYSIDVAGNVTYLPPTPSYNGTDYVDYQANDGSGVNETARIFFNVGGSVSGVVFVKSFTKNTSTTTGSNGVDKHTIGEFWIGAFSDPAGQNPLDVTGLGLMINYNRTEVYVNANNPNTSVPGTLALTGTAVEVFQGTIADVLVLFNIGQPITYTLAYPIQAGNGYTAL